MNEQQLTKVVENISEGTANIQDELLNTGKRLAALSSFEALVILYNAKYGIKADTSAHSKLGVTKSRYYSNLMQLKNAGMIKKKGKFYFQTTLGSFLHENCIIPAVYAIRNQKKLLVIDLLESHGKFSHEDLLQIKHDLQLMSLGGTH